MWDILVQGPLASPPKRWIQLVSLKQSCMKRARMGNTGQGANLSDEVFVTLA